MTAWRAFLALTWALSSVAALAVSPDQYLAIRRQHGWDRTLTYEAVAADWTACSGTVFEVVGTLNGYIQSERSLIIMLSLPQGSAVHLTVPPAELPMLLRSTGLRIRALVRVGSGVIGNVVPLETLAITTDAEVRLREQAAAQSEARRQAAQRGAVSRHTTPASGVRLRPLPGAVKGLSELARRYLTPEAQAIYPKYYAFIANHNKRLRPDEVDAIAVSILYFAHRHRVDPRLIVAMIIAESDFNPRSTSHKGAMGLGQIMPDEARAFGLRNPYDPIENVRASVNMLRMKLDMYREQGVPEGQMTLRQIQLAMAAYNAGAGAVRRYGGIPPYRETQRYVQRVVTLYRQLCGN